MKSANNNGFGATAIIFTPISLLVAAVSVQYYADHFSHENATLLQVSFLVVFLLCFITGLFLIRRVMIFLESLPDQPIVDDSTAKERQTFGGYSSSASNMGSTNPTSSWNSSGQEKPYSGAYSYEYKSSSDNSSYEQTRRQEERFSEIQRKQSELSNSNNPGDSGRLQSEINQLKNDYYWGR